MFEVMQDTLAKYAMGDGLCIHSYVLLAIRLNSVPQNLLQCPL